MDLLLILITPLIVLINHTGTGLALLRRSRLKPDEKLVGALVVSGVVTYLIGFIGYLAGQPEFLAWLTFIISVVCLFQCRDQCRAICWNEQVRRMLIASGLLIAWCLILMSVIRSYNGMALISDWFEHYERALFFGRQRNIGIDYGFLQGMYSLPARPPFQNVVTSVAIAPSGYRFESYLFAMATLNALIAPAGMLLLSTIARRGRRVIWVYSILLALSPVFLVNSTYAWTKLYSGFYALVGIYFFLRIYSKPDWLRLILCAICFAAGAMVHYSIVPYILVLAIPFTHRVFQKPRAYLAPTMISAGIAIALAMTWIVFSVIHFGWAGTALNNTTVSDSAALSLMGNIEKYGRNLFQTFFPTWTSSPVMAITGISYVRDRLLLILTTVLPFMWGSGGLILLFTHNFLSDAKPARWFWIYYLCAISILGVLIHGAPVVFGGLGFIAFDPLVIHGLGLVAVALRGLKNSWLRGLVVLCFVLETFFGIGAHFYLQSIPLEVSISGNEVSWTRAPELPVSAYQNLAVKRMYGLSFPFDHWAQARWILLGIIGAVLIVLILSLARRQVEINIRAARSNNR